MIITPPLNFDSIEIHYNYPSDFEDFINENSEFNQYNMGSEVQTPFGPGYGFASDPSLSIYSDDNRPYVDMYARNAGSTNKLMQMGQKAARDLFSDPRFNKRSDIFKFLDYLQY